MHDLGSPALEPSEGDVGVAVLSLRDVRVDDPQAGDSLKLRRLTCAQELREGVVVTAGVVVVEAAHEVEVRNGRCVDLADVEIGAPRPELLE